MIRKLSTLELWGLIAPMAMMIMMMVVWFIAYFSPGREILIGIDWYGEVKYELVLVPSATFLAILGQWKILTGKTSHD